MQQQFHLDPQAQAVLDRARASGIPPLSSLPPAQARTVYRAGRLPTQPSAPQDVHSRDFQLEVPAGHALPVREYRPVGQEAAGLLPALVFFHGGGWVVGDRDTHDVLCRMLCHHGGFAVYSVDYRLAPEFRFPAAFDDACAAIQGLAERAGLLAIDATRMAVGGDSAGAIWRPQRSLPCGKMPARAWRRSCWCIQSPTCWPVAARMKSVQRVMCCRRPTWRISGTTMWQTPLTWRIGGCPRCARVARGATPSTGADGWLRSLAR